MTFSLLAAHGELRAFFKNIAVYLCVQKPGLQEFVASSDNIITDCWISCWIQKVATDQGARAQHRVHVKRDMSQGAATAFLRVKFWVNIEVVLEKKKSMGNYYRFTQVQLIFLPVTVRLTVYLTPPPTSRLACCQNKQSSIQDKLCCHYSKQGKICISSLFSISLRDHSQCVGSSGSKVVNHKLWSRRCQGKALFHGGEKNNQTNGISYALLQYKD